MKNWTIKKRTIMNKIILLISALAMVACKTDKPTIGPQELHGSWDIIQATRDGEIFDALAGGYFEFANTNIFQTNIPSLPNGVAFVVESEKIRFEGDTLKYKITNYSDTLLVLESNIRGSAFQFTCKRR